MTPTTSNFVTRVVWFVVSLAALWITVTAVFWLDDHSPWYSSPYYWKSTHFLLTVISCFLSVVFAGCTAYAIFGNVGVIDQTEPTPHPLDITDDDKSIVETETNTGHPFP